MPERPCYVCERGVALSEPELLDGGFHYIKELDENGHAICQACHLEIIAIVTATQVWPSSEDRELYWDNIATEALMRGIQFGQRNLLPGQ